MSKSVRQPEVSKSVNQILKELEELRLRITRVEEDDTGQKVSEKDQKKLKSLAELNESQERFRETFEQAAVGIAHVAPDGHFIRINRKFCDIVGYTMEEMLARTFQDITHPDDLSTDLKYVAQMFAREIETYSMEKRYFRKDKTIVLVNLTVSLVLEDNDKPKYFIALVEDITKRRKAEERFKLLIEQASDGFFVLGYDGSIFDVNRQACKSLGFSREELLTMNIAEVDIEVTPMEHKKKFWNSLKADQSFRKKEKKMVDYSNSGKDFEIPVDIMEKWQRMVNIMSKLLRVPTGFIMKVNAPHIQIFTTNVADTNPYHAGQNFELADLYCEEVMKSDNLLLVPDALKDPEWDNNPEILAGFIYYLGYPIHWPAGKLFGTICVQDYENNLHATDNKDLLNEFRSVCELDLLMVQMRMNLESIVAERTLSLRMSEERSRRAIEERLRFQELISRISMKFTGLIGDEFEQAIQDAFNQMSAKQSLTLSSWVRSEVANTPSPNRGKTLEPRSEKPGYNWKRL